MEVYKPLRAVIFSYDILRLLFLAFSAEFFPSLEAVARGGFFPFLVYLSSNALFPIISFFIFLYAAEYKNYFPLYMAGKIIAVVLFYAWAFFSVPSAMGFMGRNQFFEAMLLLGSAFFISIGDALSLGGIWILNKKLSRNETREQQ